MADEKMVDKEQRNTIPFTLHPNQQQFEEDIEKEQQNPGQVESLDWANEIIPPNFIKKEGSWDAQSQDSMFKREINYKEATILEIDAYFAQLQVVMGKMQFSYCFLTKWIPKDQQNLGQAQEPVEMVVIQATKQQWPLFQLAYIVKAKGENFYPCKMASYAIRNETVFHELMAKYYDILSEYDLDKGELGRTGQIALDGEDVSKISKLLNNEWDFPNVQDFTIAYRKDGHTPWAVKAGVKGAQLTFVFKGSCFKVVDQEYYGKNLFPAISPGSNSGLYYALKHILEREKGEVKKAFNQSKQLPPAVKKVKK